jgi:hypothetical protein
MGELGRESDLAQKTLGAREPDVLIDNLDGDGAIVAEVAREIDRGHPATSELTLDGVAVGQRGTQTIRGGKPAAHALGDRHVAKLRAGRRAGNQRDGRAWSNLSSRPRTSRPRCAPTKRPGFP